VTKGVNTVMLKPNLVSSQAAATTKLTVVRALAEAMQRAGGGGDTASILLGNGDGTFQGQVVYLMAGPSVAAGDFNGDGRPDLVKANGDLGIFDVLINTTGLKGAMK